MELQNTIIGSYKIPLLGVTKYHYWELQNTRDK